MFNSLSKVLQISVLLLLLIFGLNIAYGQKTDDPKTESQPTNLIAVAIRFYELKQYDKAVETATNAANYFRKTIALGQ